LNRQSKTYARLAKSGEAPIASEAVRRIDVLFEIERAINGQPPEQRLAVRREESRPLVVDLEILDASAASLALVK
jgi:transposase